MPEGVPDGHQPWWYRALAPLRSEGAMFNVLLATVAICAVIAGATLLIRALT